MKPLIDSHQLKVFVMVARVLNMSRAARELGLTPSAVSHSLKGLEDDLEGRLFDRSSRNLSLSPLGAALLPDAEEILERVESLRAKVRHHRPSNKRQLRIGACTTACQFVLPPAVREFHQSFPEHAVKIEPGSATELVARLLAGQIDLALMLRPAEHPGADCRPLIDDELRFVVHPMHAWAGKRRITPDEVPRVKLIVPDRNGPTYALIEAYFREERVALEPFLEVASEEAIKQFVRLDVGVGILPAWIAGDELEQGALVSLPLGRRRLTRRWGVLYRSEKPLGLAESVFISTCREVFRGLVAERH